MKYSDTQKCSNAGQDLKNFSAQSYSLIMKKAVAA